MKGTEEEQDGGTGGGAAPGLENKDKEINSKRRQPNDFLNEE